MSTGPTDALTLAERERLYILMEECAEVTKECAKILRFGFEPTDLTDPTLAVKYNNRATLTIEIGDVLAAFELLMTHDVKESEVIAAAKAKLEKLKRYTKHQ
jgi:hypothetical protein